MRRNREPSRIPVKKVLIYLNKNILQESNEEIYFKNFPVSSHLHDLCKHYRTWSFQYNRDNACRWNVFSSSVTKRKCHKSRFRTFKFKSVLNSVSTTCTCNTNSGTSCSLSSYLSGGIAPHSLSSSNTNLASVSRFNGQIIYLPQRAGRLSQRSQRVNSTGKEYCESTGEKYCEWAAKHIKISCLPRE